ncbi:AAA family ATPase [Kyrpidia tusciae]|uniref:ATPase-like protein n=1 Tax=Kyrpidia tusciae (strain DSM 2912 / NBRC 15312 / T2) TaxID=562970 RepID=D5WVM1_KYRT2|nr:ATP-binding protein [Kyrpidia tusciae]ADG07564.1 conserved hypothetical protein [Kyrpidia tusciae DSM 2912]
MLKSFQVTNFRIFSDLKIETLGTVNLIIGKNNSGKSSLLEALRLYSFRGSPAVIIEMLNSRDEMPKQRVQEFSEYEVRTFFGVSYLFYRHRINGDRTIKMGPIGSADKILSLSLEWYQATQPPEGPVQWQVVSSPLEADQQALRPALTIRWGSDQKGRLWLDETMLEVRNRPIVGSEWFLDRDTACCFVPAGGLRQVDVVRWWEGVALTEEEEDVLRALRLIEPDVERIAMVSVSRGAPIGIPMVRIRGVSFPVPLRNLGEGMNRLFGIILALVNAKNGVLLVDEIENGVHYTVQPELWRLIIHTAKRLNVQVFATTHSWDCIEAFQAAVQDSKNDGPGTGFLIRLNRQQGGLATIYDESDLAVITRDHVEVR